MIEKILNLLFDREDIKREHDSVVYMMRWFIFTCMGHRLCIHKMLRADHDKCLHDHPWSFVTMVLYGGYEEELPGGVISRAKPMRVYSRKGAYPHRISKLLKKFSYTLVWMKPKNRKWGFYTNNGWMYHKEFLLKPNMSAQWCNSEDEYAR